ncbi:DNA (cytosine-5-)-methyltransferase [Cytobacillus firmus]|uniref:DNA cytosine methyltransferase n=1 Tax=Cytobacillus firmus TaxID=1399 RepID=UPI00237B2AD5|nr:DNA (cytosine-5-)-methyltransferase [Cytobacillus firmus]MDD9309800.1 DNA (cytosine-5-)-methyltransferase [Cytobacillus firmus]
MIQVGSLFSGAIDGMSLGFGMASERFKTVIANEIENTAVKTAKLNYQHEIIQSDIRDISIDSLNQCDVILGTFPCQEYSKAAHIHKNGRKDNWKQAYHWASIRDLFLHYFRFIALVRPEVYIWENSPEVRKHPIVMETFRKLPPYHYYEVELDTADFMLPQRRKRLFVVGFKRPFTMPDPHDFQIHDRQLTIKDIREKDPIFSIPDYVKSRIDGKYRDLPSIKTDDDISNTCVAHYARDKGTTMIHDPRGYKNLRPFTVREYARLMGIPDTFQFANGESTNFKHIGNAVSPLPARALGKVVESYFAS